MGNEEKRSRAEIAEKDGIPIHTPPVFASYVLNFLSDLGWAGSGGMGAAPLSAVEVKAWAELSDIELTPWEFAAIKSASRAYVSQSYEENQDAPYTPEEAPKPRFISKFQGMAKQLNKAT